MWTLNWNSTHKYRQECILRNGLGFWIEHLPSVSISFALIWHQNTQTQAVVHKDMLTCALHGNAADGQSIVSRQRSAWLKCQLSVSQQFPQWVTKWALIDIAMSSCNLPQPIQPQSIPYHSHYRFTRPDWQIPQDWQRLWPLGSRKTTSVSSLQVLFLHKQAVMMSFKEKF